MASSSAFSFSAASSSLFLSLSRSLSPSLSPLRSHRLSLFPSFSPSPSLSLASLLPSLFLCLSPSLSLSLCLCLFLCLRRGLNLSSTHTHQRAVWANLPLEARRARVASEDVSMHPKHVPKHAVFPREVLVCLPLHIPVGDSPLGGGGRVGKVYSQ